MSYGTLVKTALGVGAYLSGIKNAVIPKSLVGKTILGGLGLGAGATGAKVAYDINDLLNEKNELLGKTLPMTALGLAGGGLGGYLAGSKVQEMKTAYDRKVRQEEFKKEIQDFIARNPYAANQKYGAISPQMAKILAGLGATGIGAGIFTGLTQTNPYQENIVENKELLKNINKYGPWAGLGAGLLGGGLYGYNKIQQPQIPKSGILASMI